MSELGRGNFFWSLVTGLMATNNQAPDGYLRIGAEETW